MSGLARRTGLALVCAGALVVSGGIVIALGAGGRAQPPPPAPLANVGRVPSGAAPGADPPARRTREHANRTPTTPAVLPRGSQLIIGGQHAEIGRVRVVQHEMQIPRDPRRVGWWRASAVPGARSGGVVIVGHVNYAGVTGTLSVLPDLRPGDRIAIVEGHRRHDYAVTGVRSYSKAAGLPNSVFAQGGRPRLVLITCGGSFDSATGNYLDNVVAYAVPRS